MQGAEIRCQVVRRRSGTIGVVVIVIYISIGSINFSVIGIVI